MEFRVKASDYGYANDGEWHSLTIPLSDFETLGWDIRSVRSPMFFSGATPGQVGETLLVDDVYMQ